MDHPPAKGFFIVGTWSAWQHMQRMEEEEEGVYGFTLSMGENNWEEFQVWVDGSEEKVLHPLEPKASRGTLVGGPDRNVGKQLAWRISGRAETSRLLNEEQFANLKGSCGAIDKCVVAFAGGYVPNGFQNSNLLDMPLVKLNHGMEGKPRDRYRIRLYINGPERRLEWAKTRGIDAIIAPARPKFVHSYHIIGDHSDWTFQMMSTNDEGNFCAEVQLLKENGNFQIFRDADWEQGFYPDDTGTDIQGPDGSGHDRCWKISGKQGDIFRVEFQRKVVGHDDNRSIRWEYLRSEALDSEARSRSHEYFLVGSWNGFTEFKAMHQDQKTGYLKQEAVLGKTGVENFQILLNRNWMASVHPDINDATLSDDHKVLGPDSGGRSKYWAVGKDPADNLKAGDHFTVYLENFSGIPSKVWWEKHESADAHREYLAQGCQKVLERHLRLLGLVPWHGEDEPARLARKPDFWIDAE